MKIFRKFRFNKKHINKLKILKLMKSKTILDLFKLVLKKELYLANNLILKALMLYTIHLIKWFKILI